ncbi:MAG: hypothetical protein Athens101428_93 [Candidatus Berkelbacteria bacterium Athens1014_28]|uniref:Uncharacterized protein n=1 Tax=Candidatus Berkelbacteria bacterium Athens1014_28 TaxID=2017145 RepID=A0A554LPT0_9BACT|nr:MAG: hypothetical protein Athens101428_93 [Candidatus Berkelbacteria bacterium Athens1014_28]
MCDHSSIERGEELEEMKGFTGEEKGAIDRIIKELSRDNDRDYRDKGFYSGPL